MKTNVILILVGTLMIIQFFQNDIYREQMYQKEMDKKYEITELNLLNEGIPARYQFNKTVIDIHHVFSEEEPVLEESYDSTIMADVFITINNEEREILRDYPVNLISMSEKVEGLNKYSPYISYWLIYDKQTKKESFAITLQTTREQNNNGYIPKEEQDYRVIFIEEDGKVKTDAYTYKTKTKLQTKLIPFSEGGGAGYYSDYSLSYPWGLGFINPLIFPFILLVIGTVLIFINLMLIRENLVKKKINEK